MGLHGIEGEYVMLTNADNYFIPRAMEFLNEAIGQHRPDVVLYDMIHSHNNPGTTNLPAYSYFQTKYERQCIDMSAAIVKSDLARAAGFSDKSHDADATYFENVARAKAPVALSVAKIHRVLFVHN